MRNQPKSRKKYFICLMANFSIYFKQGLYVLISQWVLIIVALTLNVANLFVCLFV